MRGKHAASSRLHRPPQRIAIAIALVLAIPVVSFGVGFVGGLVVFDPGPPAAPKRSAQDLPEVSVVEFDDEEEMVDSWSGRFEVFDDPSTGEIVFEYDGAEIRVDRAHAIVLRDRALA